MKVVIPMAGKGWRFDDYLSPKPLIEIESKPMIEHVTKFFPRESEFIFLCNEDHLANTNMKEVLERIVPIKKIISVPKYYLSGQIVGPARTMTAAFPHIRDGEEVIVNYCDLIQEWDYSDFKNKILKKNPDGAILSFRGFHPSSLGDTYYAYMKVNDEGYITEIREKQAFSEDKTKDFASTGCYYFSAGKILKNYVNELLSDANNSVKGEFYMSLPYNLMIRDNLKVLNYEINKFICLGTWRDYELYKFWSEFFLKHSSNSLRFDNVNLNVTNIFPLAGGEKDFKGVGFDDLIFKAPIMGKPIIHHAYKSNPKGMRNIFIGLKEHEKDFRDLDIFKDYKSEVFLLDQKKNGNAATIYELKDKINPEAPVCVSGGTYILDFNERKMIDLMERNDIDIILFSFSHHECILRNPKFFSYAKIKNNIEVEKIVEKDVISNNPYADHSLTGTTIFRKARDLFDAIKIEMDKNPNQRLYYLSCLNNIINKRKAVIFKVDKFIPLRNPVQYMEFLYWEDFFHNYYNHPYKKSDSEKNNKHPLLK